MNGNYGSFLCGYDLLATRYNSLCYVLFQLLKVTFHVGIYLIIFL
ncbi:hypothetical protein Barb6XT_03165 [Bacteroidales bacterium Barb6XT]|nr:hypothetical protein Barb6XT_03165 [Bacteroidales bacterium Barb6XT]